MTDKEIWMVIKEMYTDPTISLILIQKMFDIARRVSDITEKEIQELESEKNFIGSTTWKGWKVDLYSGEEGEDD